MKNYTVKLYQETDYEKWNDFIGQAKNATFLFHRDFMEYHKDRFEDFSLLVFENEKLVSVLPANKVGNVVYSHQGLTYGGLVLMPVSKLYDTIFVFKAILEYLNKNDIGKLFFKDIPSIYCDYSSDEINYLMYVCNGKIIMKHNVSVISLKYNILITKSRKECIRRGQKLDLYIKEEDNLDTFWNQLLIPNLKEKYNSEPVHTLGEIMFLKSKFPDNIRHFNVYNNGELVCGTTLFITKNVVKPQYISGSSKNNILGSIDFLYDFLITEIAKNKDFFDFGPSHENNGFQIVKSINFWKESFGAHSLVQDFYEIQTSNYKLLDTVLI
ncbi:GNAT family N-acetyltransferase [Flavobacterium sp. AJR]|uniref:GNAT family N-acetyltransferase n=1 Tax=Flavobacterium sp. AJR TaxID=1979369 RepID=UPI000A3D84CA|nr:GNAT family N-acetyltransferase [Flavobacterium sp. AJR]OUL63524.1 GNAT family N-acetyltransferase [Flavobacterium sp. AJR]